MKLMKTSEQKTWERDLRRKHRRVAFYVEHPQQVVAYDSHTGDRIGTFQVEPTPRAVRRAGNPRREK